MFVFLLFLVVQSASAFTPSSSSRHIPSKLAEISQELEETWSNAAIIGEDAVERTTTLIEDRAFEYKKNALKRMKKQDPKSREITEDSIEKAAADYMGVLVPVEKYDVIYEKVINEAVNGFIDEISKEEQILKKGIHEINAEYDQALSQTQFGLTEDDIFTAKERFIERSAVVDELFKISIERAEITYAEAVIEAVENRNEEAHYFEKFGKCKPEKFDYNTPSFANLIAF